MRCSARFSVSSCAMRASVRGRSSAVRSRSVDDREAAALERRLELGGATAARAGASPTWNSARSRRAARARLRHVVGDREPAARREPRGDGGERRGRMRRVGQRLDRDRDVERALGRRVVARRCGSRCGGQARPSSTARAADGGLLLAQREARERAPSRGRRDRASCRRGRSRHRARGRRAARAGSDAARRAGA